MACIPKSTVAKIVLSKSAHHQLKHDEHVAVCESNYAVAGAYSKKNILKYMESLKVRADFSGEDYVSPTAILESVDVMIRSMSSKFEAAEAYVRLLPEGDKVIIIMRHQNALKWLRDLLISGNAV